MTAPLAPASDADDASRDEDMVGLEVWRATLEAACLARDVQTVMALRMAGFIGRRPDAASEWRRMIDEKPPAFAAAMLAMSFAAFGAQRPDRIAAIGFRPLQAQVTENMARLRGQPPASPPALQTPSAHP